MEKKERDLYLRATAKPVFRSPSILDKAKPALWQEKSFDFAQDKEKKEKPNGISLKELGSFTANIGGHAYRQASKKDKPKEEEKEANVSEATISGLQDDLRKALDHILD